MNGSSTGASPVRFEGLEKSFGDVRAVDGVTATVQAGEVFGVIGPDGAGKTTLFRILTTLIEPDVGQAAVLDLDVVDDLWEIRARVGYMPGRFSLYPDLSVEENLRFFASVFGTTPEAQMELISPIYSQIEPFSDRRASDLSGGMKQKLALSCALVHRPEVLFLDEPTTGVDAVSRREFWDLLGQMQERGLTIVVSTPYMDEAARCDRVALMSGGRLLQVATPAEVRGAFPYPLLAVRTADRNRTLRLLRSLPNAISVYPFGAELHYADRRQSAEVESIADEVRHILASEAFTSIHVESIEASVEDSFMALMGSARGVAP